jgi:hypothetical protein
MVEVIGTEEFSAWFAELDDATASDVIRTVDMLEMSGVTLGFPQSSAIVGANFALRELRVQSNGKPIRVFYAFDPARQAVLLIGGDKTGNKRFYETMIPLSERIWKEYIRENY